MSAANQLPFLMTAAVFLDWDTPDGSDRWELVDGIPRAVAPPSVRHGRIHGETGRLIGNHLAEQRPEYRISIGAGLRPNDYNVRIPDITVSCWPLVDDRLLAEPIVVVEILSPSKRRALHHDPQRAGSSGPAYGGCSRRSAAPGGRRHLAGQPADAGRVVDIQTTP
jgi:Uma2 family endonuclease